MSIAAPSLREVSSTPPVLRPKPKDKGIDNKTMFAQLNLKAHSPLYEESGDTEAYPNGKVKVGEKSYAVLGRDMEINGSAYPGSSSREIITIDDSIEGSELPVLNLRLKRRLEERIQSNTNKEEVVCSEVFAFVREVLLYDGSAIEKIATEKKNQPVEIDEFIRKGIGVCRHQGVLAAYLIGNLIKEGYIGGKISVDRNYIPDKGGHGWARYTDSNGEVMIIDAAQKFVGRMTQPPQTGWSYERSKDAKIRTEAVSSQEVNLEMGQDFGPYTLDNGDELSFSFDGLPERSITVFKDSQNNMRLLFSVFKTIQTLDVKDGRGIFRVGNGSKDGGLAKGLDLKGEDSGDLFTILINNGAIIVRPIDTKQRVLVLGKKQEAKPESQREKGQALGKREDELLSVEQISGPYEIGQSEQLELDLAGGTEPGATVTITRTSSTRMKVEYSDGSKSTSREIGDSVNYDLLVGRSSNSDLVVNNENVSRKHCRILISKGLVSIQNFSPTNGTSLSSRKIENAQGTEAQQEQGFQNLWKRMVSSRFKQ
jgi:hypothetical protein